MPPWLLWLLGGGAFVGFVFWYNRRNRGIGENYTAGLEDDDYETPPEIRAMICDDTMRRGDSLDYNGLLQIFPDVLYGPPKP